MAREPSKRIPVCGTAAVDRVRHAITRSRFQHSHAGLVARSKPEGSQLWANHNQLSSRKFRNE
eukprot:7348537-Prymnesium_polylepis.1